MGGTVRIMLVDSDEVTLAGMSEVLRKAPGLDVVAAVESGEAALDLLADTAPDVVFIADRLQRMSGAAACAAITERRPASAVVVLSVEPTEEVIASYVLAGARGFLTRGARREDLAAAARGASHGTCFLSAPVADRVIKWAARAITAHDVGLWLSPQEIEILAMVERGLPNRTIARRVGTSLGTLKGQLSHIMRKLGATRRADAVTIAIKRGLIPAASGTATASVIPIDRRESNVADHGRFVGGDGLIAEKRPGMGQIRVVVVDDREVIREGLVAVLRRSADMDVLGESSNSIDAAVQLAEVEPDLVLVGGGMRQSTALELCRFAADRRLRARIVILAGPGTTVRDVREALLWGARGCLVGEVRAGSVEHAVRAAIHDGLVTSNGALIGWEQLWTLEESTHGQAEGSGTGALTTIESRILRLLSQGKTNPEIACALDLSVDAVKRQVKAIYRELHVASRAEAAAIAVREHLV